MVVEPFEPGIALITFPYLFTLIVTTTIPSTWLLYFGFTRLVTILFPKLIFPLLPCLPFVSPFVSPFMEPGLPSLSSLFSVLFVLFLQHLLLIFGF